MFILLFSLNSFVLRAEYAVNPSESSSINDKVLFNYYETEVLDRLKNLNTIVDFQTNEDVMDQVRRYVVVDRNGSKSILDRSNLYFPLIERLLFDNNLPSQLKSLAALESALNPDAHSYAGAAGLWQLMPETARELGLKVNKSIDERLDPVASSKAAINYIKKLYEMFGDWSLVLAAYNCGEYKIKALVEEKNSKDFNFLKSFLPRQTQLFIPTFIGVSYMLEYYTEHNLIPSELELPNSYLTYVKIDRPINLNKLYKETKINKELFKSYNPSFKSSEIGKSSGGVYVTLPDSMMVEFVDYYLNKYSNTVDTSHMVESVQGQLLLELISFSRPEITAAEKIEPAETPVIEYNSQDYTQVKETPTVTSESIKNYQYHILHTGESLSDVAQQYNLAIEDLMKWNKLDYNDNLMAGSVITIRH